MTRIAVAGALAVMAVMAASARPLSAQDRDARSGRVQGAVYDSVARAPLTGGTVTLLSVRDSLSQRTGTLDRAGRFVFDSLAPGPWVARVRHPRLDSLALRELEMPFDVRSGRRTALALAVPSARVLANRACGVNLSPEDTSGYLVGTLRRAESGAPVAGGTVRVQWMEFVLTGTRPVRELVTIDAPTDAHGVYVACGVPASATVLVRAASAPDSSGRAPIALPATGIRYRDVYVGRGVLVDDAAAMAAAKDSTSDSLGVVADSAARLVPPRLLRGTGQVSGRVRDARGRSLANARVALPIAGREVRTDSAGRFLLDGLPSGTHALEVRALGFDPISDAVDVVANVSPLSFEMVRFESLDTVRVRASRAKPLSRRFAEFEQRRRMGMGKFFTSDDVERINPLRLSDLFSRVGGLVMMWRNGERVPTMRGLTFRGRCIPIFIVDGFPFPEDASLDAFIAPMSVIGVEVYSTAFTPGEFSRPFAPCGTIVIWTGARPENPPRPR